MSDMRYARMATALLSKQPRAALSDSLGDRSASVYVVEHALRGRARRRVWRNVGFSTAAAAVVAVGWGFALHSSPKLVERATTPSGPALLTATGHAGHGAGATLVRGSAAEALGPRVPLRAGDRLRALVSADLVVSLSTGTRLGLAGTGELGLVQLDQVQQFYLPKGRLRADVAKLETGQRFLIRTTDSEIEVRGTSFEVTAMDGTACADGTRTRVEVFEGTVTVRRGTGQPVFVEAGSSWPADCHPGESAAVAVPLPVSPTAPAKPELASHRRRLAVVPREAPAPAPIAAAPAPVARAPVALAPAAPVVAAPAPVVVAPAPVAAAPAPAAPSEAPPPPASVASSTLAEQNDLFAAALQARHDGDTTKALRRLDELLTRFPGGPLAEGAAHEQRKLLAERRHSRPNQ